MRVDSKVEPNEAYIFNHGKYICYQKPDSDEQVIVLFSGGVSHDAALSMYAPPNSKALHAGAIIYDSQYPEDVPSVYGSSFSLKLYCDQTGKTNEVIKTWYENEFFPAMQQYIKKRKMWSLSILGVNI